MNQQAFAFFLKYSTSDPAIFGQLIIDSGLSSRETSDKLFKTIRLLPSRARFRKCLGRNYRN